MKLPKNAVREHALAVVLAVNAEIIQTGIGFTVFRRKFYRKIRLVFAACVAYRQCKNWVFSAC